MILSGVVQELPGQVGQRGSIGQAQADSQSAIVVQGLFDAAAELRDQFAGKNGVEQFAAEFLSRAQFGRIGAARAAPNLSDAAQEIAYFHLRERKNELGRGLPCRSIQTNAILVSDGFNQQVEIIVL